MMVTKFTSDPVLKPFPIFEFRGGVIYGPFQ